ncbi:MULTISPECIES: hypothetical protein [Streptacidiphilus]|uniref:ABC transmembrane type-1 domain-containing protein n=1 Tax=Streptacidiphilus cavernicola TaxID=3342716 RepID=A0ABV6UIQ2_9ACTN|nr:hypothetical protein [Streptacidiphilus jeojiense]
MTSTSPTSTAQTGTGETSVGTSAETRADRFVRDLAALKIPDPAAGRATLWLRLGVVLMLVGPVLAVTAYLMSRGTTDSLTQGDALTVALAGITASVVGAALFLRYSLIGFLRFWLARQSYDLSLLADRLLERDLRHDLTGNEAAPR